MNTYFEYSEGNNYQSPILEIKCKESLIQIVEDIGLKLESFNSNLNLPIIPPLVLNQSQPNQPIGNNQPMTELEKALEEIKALKEANAAKELEIANMVSREAVEQLINRKSYPFDFKGLQAIVSEAKNALDISKKCIGYK